MPRRASWHNWSRAGRCRTAKARLVTAHGFATVLARSFWRERGRAEPPAAFIFNVKPLLARRMARSFGLVAHPLFTAAGAAPSRRVLDTGRLSADYFGHYRTELARVVPEAVMARGIAAAVRHLVERGFDGWERLPISLPYLFLDDAPFRASMGRLRMETDAVWRERA